MKQMENGAKIADQKNGLLKFSRGRFVLLAFALVAAGMLAGWEGRMAATSGKKVTVQRDEVREGGYKFISPLLLADVSIVRDQEFKPLEKRIHDETYDLLNDPGIRTVSIYFRDLLGGRWMGINEDAIYDSASLLKVPLLIAYLKRAESDPEIFSRKILYRGEPEDKKNLEFYNLELGREYTVEELLHLMIAKSDNSAKDLLLGFLDFKTQNDVFSKLGLPLPTKNAQYEISPKIYSYFFRLLYNATYLNRDNSELALTLLSETDYKDGLVAGIPANITIAHKFGQHGTETLPSNAISEWELHDCGIIYHPDRPYFLCVMTRGQVSENLAS